MKGRHKIVLCQWSQWVTVGVRNLPCHTGPLGDTLSLTCEASVGESGSNN